MAFILKAHGGQRAAVGVFLLLLLLLHFFFSLPKSRQRESVCKVSQWGLLLTAKLPMLYCNFFWTLSAASGAEREKAPAKQIERKFDFFFLKRETERNPQEEKKSASPSAPPSTRLNLGYSTVDLTPKYRACRLFMSCYCDANARNRGFSGG